LRPQSGQLFGGELEHEVFREALAVAADLFVEALIPVLDSGRRVGNFPSLIESREHCARELQALPWPLRELSFPTHSGHSQRASTRARRREILRCSGGLGVLARDTSRAAAGLGLPLAPLADTY
jgi:hypothetical protein